jgi:DNA-binding NarL/FixJ family response regulator
VPQRPEHNDIVPMKVKAAVEIAVILNGNRSVLGTIPLEFALTSPAAKRITPRQEQVLDLLLAGKSNKEIANQIFLSERTVKFHVASLLRFYGVSSRAELIAGLKK